MSQTLQGATTTIQTNEPLDYPHRLPINSNVIVVSTTIKERNVGRLRRKGKTRPGYSKTSKIMAMIFFNVKAIYS